MSKKAAPWINLSRDRPVLDAENRDAINEWCGVVGKQEKYRSQRKRNIQFPSRAVNWKKQQQKRPNDDALRAVELLNDVKGGQHPSNKPNSSRRSKTSDNAGRRSPLSTKSAPRSRMLMPKKRTSPSPRVPTLAEEEASAEPKVLWQDGSMGIRVDPFDCVPGTTDDPRQGEILDYYKQILDPGVVATFFVFDMRSTYGTMPLECLADDEFRPLGLASIAGTMSSVKHAAVNREYIFTQYGRGMRLLRRRLYRHGNSEGDIILISIMFLAATAYVTGDLDGFEIHRNNLKQAVAQRGGLDKLGYGGGTKTVLLQWDSAWKLSTGKSLWIDDLPRPAPVYPSVPLNERTLTVVKHLPIGFHKVCQQGLICIELMRVLLRMASVMSHSTARSIPYNQKIGQRDDYLSVSSLYAMGNSDERNLSHSATLEALLSLGLILFSSTVLNEMRATPVIFRGPKDALLQRLMNPSYIKLRDRAQTHCYQWVWAVSIDAWRDASRELLPQGRQLLDEFHNRYASQWKTSDDLVKQLKRFFWTEDLVNFHKESLETYRTQKAQNDPS